MSYGEHRTWTWKHVLFIKILKGQCYFLLKMLETEEYVRKEPNCHLRFPLLCPEHPARAQTSVLCTVPGHVSCHCPMEPHHCPHSTGRLSPHTHTFVSQPPVLGRVHWCHSFPTHNHVLCTHCLLHPHGPFFSEHPDQLYLWIPPICGVAVLWNSWYSLLMSIS
jgi:hypothetical protein